MFLQCFYIGKIFEGNMQVKEKKKFSKVDLEEALLVLPSSIIISTQNVSE